MAMDYGVRRRSGRGLAVAMVGLIVVGGGGLMLADAHLEHAKALAADRAEVLRWIVRGPPCPPASKAQMAASTIALRRQFDFGPVSFSRGYGDVSCREFRTEVSRQVGGQLVCQFTGPSALQVTTRQGDFYFLPKATPATVVVDDGKPRCVAAINFRAGPGSP